MANISKKEQERREQEAKEQRIRAALHWTEEAAGPDVAPPTDWKVLSTGYLFNAYTGRVDVACSSTVSHAYGRTDRTDTQGARHLYSTRYKALLAMRNVVEDECAERLLAIDRMIEQEGGE